MDNSVSDIAQVKTKKLNPLYLIKIVRNWHFLLFFQAVNLASHVKRQKKLSWSNILTDDYLITLKGLHQTLITCFSVKKFYN